MIGLRVASYGLREKSMVQGIRRKAKGAESEEHGA
jgi:hypothetical protein